MKRSEVMNLVPNGAAYNIVFPDGSKLLLARFDPMPKEEFDAYARAAAWSLDQLAKGRRLSACTIDQKPIDDDGNLEPWVIVEYEP